MYYEIHIYLKSINCYSFKKVFALTFASTTYSIEPILALKLVHNPLFIIVSYHSDSCADGYRFSWKSGWKKQSYTVALKTRIKYIRLILQYFKNLSSFDLISKVFLSLQLRHPSTSIFADVYLAKNIHFLPQLFLGDIRHRLSFAYSGSYIQVNNRSRDNQFNLDEIKNLIFVECDSHSSMIPELSLLETKLSNHCLIFAREFHLDFKILKKVRSRPVKLPYSPYQPNTSFITSMNRFLLSQLFVVTPSIVL